MTWLQRALLAPALVFKDLPPQKGRTKGKRGLEREGLLFVAKSVCLGFRAEALVAAFANHIFVFVVSFNNDMRMQKREDISAPMALDLPSVDELNTMPAAFFFSVHKS
jgi:hypothetical protein